MEGQEANENSFEIGQDIADAAEFGAGRWCHSEASLGTALSIQSCKTAKPRSLCPFPPRPGWGFCLLCRPIENTNPAPSSRSSFKK